MDFAHLVPVMRRLALEAGTGHPAALEFVRAVNGRQVQTQSVRHQGHGVTQCQQTGVAIREQTGHTQLIAEHQVVSPCHSHGNGKGAFRWEILLYISGKFFNCIFIRAPEFKGIVKRILTKTIGNRLQGYRLFTGATHQSTVNKCIQGFIKQTLTQLQFIKGRFEFGGIIARGVQHK